MFFLLLHMNPSSQGHRVGQAERWVCWSVAVVGDNSCSCCQECICLLCVIRMRALCTQWLENSTCLKQLAEYSCLGMSEGVLEKTPFLSGHSGSGAITVATSHKSEWAVNNCSQLWVCTAQLRVACLDCWVCGPRNLNLSSLMSGLLVLTQQH